MVGEDSLELTGNVPDGLDELVGIGCRRTQHHDADIGVELAEEAPVDGHDHRTGIVRVVQNERVDRAFAIGKQRSWRVFSRFHAACGPEDHRGHQADEHAHTDGCGESHFCTR